MVKYDSPGKGSSEEDKGGLTGVSEGKLSGVSEVVTTVLDVDQNVSENITGTANTRDPLNSCSSPPVIQKLETESHTSDREGGLSAEPQCVR